jgi:SAM-dependent methyltransferase
MKLALAALLAALASVHAMAQTPPTHAHGFAGAEQWARHFDDPARDGWQKPHEVIRALELTPDAVVADIGAGTGYFAVRLARMTPRGRVYAVDIEPDMVRYLTERARREKLANLQAILGSPADPKLPSKVDQLLIVDTYHHIDDREQYFRLLRGYLKPGGEVAIIDFTRDSPIGPPAGMRIDSRRVREEMERAGYVSVAEHQFLPHQYFLVFRPR